MWRSVEECERKCGGLWRCGVWRSVEDVEDVEECEKECGGVWMSVDECG